MRTETLLLVGSWLLTYLVHSTLLLGTVWALTRRAVQHPALRDLLWKAALTGGIVTATVQVGLGFEPVSGMMQLGRGGSAVVRPMAAPAPQDATVPGDWSGLVVSSSAEPTLSRDVAVAAPAVPAAASLPVPAAAASMPALTFLDLMPWLLVAWGLGAVALVGIYLLRRARALRGIGPRCPVADHRLVAMLEGLRHRGGVRRPIRLTAAAGLGSPVALGWREIVVPEAALTDLDAGQQESLLAHELAHLRRHDPLWLAVACVIERALFVQPLNRLARVRLQEAAEYLCDDWAVHRTGSGVSLATCLVKVAEWVDTTPRPVPLAGMAERRSQLVTRIHRLIEGRPMSRTPRSLWLAATAFFLVGVTAVAAPGVSPAPAEAPSEPAVEETDLSAFADAMAFAGVADTDTTVTPEPDLAPPARAGRAWSRAVASADMRRALTEARIAGTTPRPPRPPRPPTVAYAPAAPPAGWAQVDAWRERGPRDTNNIAVPALIAALKDSDVEVRRVAAQSLANLQDPRAVPGLMEAAKDPDEQVRASALMALGEIGDKRALPALLAGLKDGAKQVKYAALSGLHQMPGAVPDDAILTALADSDREIRQAAVGLALSRMSDDDRDGARADSRYVTVFVKLLSDPDAELRGQAAMALGECGLTEAPPALLAAARDRNVEVRQAVAMALGRIRDPKGVPVLKTLLEDANSDVRQQAVASLAEIRDKTAVEALVGALKASDPEVRRYAAMALGQREDW